MLTMLTLFLFQFTRATFSVMKDEYAEQYSKLKDKYEASINLYIITSATNEKFEFYEKLNQPNIRISTQTNRTI